MTRTLLVVAGGEQPLPSITAVAPSPDLVIGVDSGVDTAIALGYVVDVAVGDFDSVSAAGLAAAERSGALVERHPVDKDQTDLELALLKAVSYLPDLIIVIGLGGGRADHYLANLLLLASPRFQAVHIDAYVGDAKFSVVRSERTLAGRVGELVSLLPIGGEVTGISTSGLQYKLSNETLRATSPRGVSNTLTTPLAKVTVGDGALLVVQPDRLVKDWPATAGGK